MSQLTMLNVQAILEIEACTMLEIELKARLESFMLRMEKWEAEYEKQTDIRKDLQNLARNFHNLNGSSIKRKITELGETK